MRKQQSPHDRQLQPRSLPGTPDPRYFCSPQTSHPGPAPLSTSALPEIHAPFSDKWCKPTDRNGWKMSSHVSATPLISHPLPRRRGPHRVDEDLREVENRGDFSLQTLLAPSFPLSNHLPSRPGSRARLRRQRNLIKMHCQVVKVFELKKKNSQERKYLMANNLISI